MRIGILGGGPVGKALARLVVSQGHAATIGSRQTAALVDLASRRFFAQLCALTYPIFYRVSRVPCLT